MLMIPNMVQHKLFVLTIKQTLFLGNCHILKNTVNKAAWILLVFFAVQSGINISQSFKKILYSSHFTLMGDCYCEPSWRALILHSNLQPLIAVCWLQVEVCALAV